MKDLYKYTDSMIPQTAKVLYRDAIDECAHIKYMQEAIKRGNGVVQKIYSQETYDNKFMKTIALYLASHIEKYGIKSEFELLIRDPESNLALLKLVLDYALNSDGAQALLIAKKISNLLYGNVCKYSLTEIEEDIQERYEDYYESGQYSKEKAEDMGMVYFSQDTGMMEA